MSISQTIPTIPGLPAGNEATPANYPAAAQALVDRLETLPGELNTWAGQANALATDANAKAATATAGAALATVEADRSTSQAGRAEDEADRSYSEAERSRAFADQAKGLAGTAITGTSATELTLTKGAKALTLELGKAFVAGCNVELVRTSDPTESKMRGRVTAYNAATGSMSVDVDSVTGAGTFSDWSIRIVPETAGNNVILQHFLANS